MTTSAIKATATTLITATTVFAAAAHGGSFDQRVEFPEMMTMQEAYLEQRAAQRPTLNATADLAIALGNLHTVADDVELAGRLAALEQQLAAHVTALREARSDIKKTYKKTQSEFAYHAKTVEDVAPVEREITDAQHQGLSVIREALFEGGRLDATKVPENVKTMLAGLKSRLSERIVFNSFKTGANTSIASIASVHGFLDVLEAHYDAIDYHIEVTALLHVIVKNLHMQLIAGMVNGNRVAPTLFGIGGEEKMGDIFGNIEKSVNAISNRHHQELREEDWR